MRLPTPTKAEELDALLVCAGKLGANSYLGPWLLQIADEAEAVMRSDIYPEISISRTVRHCEEMLKTAREHTEEIKTKATKEAEAIKTQARQDCNHIRGRIVHLCSETINNFSH